MKTLKKCSLKGKKALIRVDFNVPLNDEGKVTDASRILAAKPTIDAVAEAGGKLILMSHLGRPKGVEERYSLSHIVDEVRKITGRTVHFVHDCIGDEVEKAAGELKEGEILLLENLRFHTEEKAGDEGFAKALAKLGDVYINDAFGTAHRAHASTAVVAQYFQEKCFGLLMEKELKNIEKVLHSSVPPVVAILGGAKVSSKIGVIENLLDKVNHLIIGGAMSFTFIKANGGEIGASMYEEDNLELAKQIMEKAASKGVKLHLPVDVVAADRFAADANSRIVPAGEIPDGWMGLDIGPKTQIAFSFLIMQARTVLWNGPMGVFEFPAFAEGTMEIGQAVADATRDGAYTLVGGGDSVAAIKKMNLSRKVSYVSTGGGAMLEALEGKVLPGVAAIEEEA